jgi:hypothetical protein
MILSGLRCVLGGVTVSDETLIADRWPVTDCLKFIDRAASKKVDRDRYAGTGRSRYFDPVALCISELFGNIFSDDILQPKDNQLVCTARGAAAHYFEVTRVLLGGCGTFSPLAYANRSLNAIPAQVSQMIGLHGGAFTLATPPGQPLQLLRYVWRRLQAAHSPRRILLCGGQFPSLHPLSRRVYAEQAESPDICLTLVVGLPAGDCEALWAIDWNDTGAETDRNGILFRVAPQGHAELLHDGKLVAQSRSNKDVLVPLLQALLIACSFRTEPIAIRDLSGLTCLLRWLR